MSTNGDIDLLLAQRVKLERLTRGWSIADLATKSGVSRAMISKIERMETSATAALLVRLASAFQLTLAGLLARCEHRANRVSRKADQARWIDPQSGYSRRQILAQDDFPLELISVELPATSSVTLPAASLMRIRQAVWVLEGTLTLDESDERHVLEEGDCIAFGPPAEVIFANTAQQRCRYVVALTREGDRNWK